MSVLDTIVKSVMISDRTLATFYFFPNFTHFQIQDFYLLKSYHTACTSCQFWTFFLFVFWTLRSNNYELSFLQLHICYGIRKRFLPLKFHVSSFESFPMPFFVNMRTKELVFPYFAFSVPSLLNEVLFREKKKHQYWV